MTYNELASVSGVTASSVYSMMDPTRENVSIVLIRKLCDGLEITLSTFFNSEEFNSLDQEIKKICNTGTPFGVPVAFFRYITDAAPGP